MKHFIISDDSYFLAGAKELLKQIHIYAEVINSSCQSSRLLSRMLCPGDVVIIATDNISAREALARKAAAVSCRVMFMSALHKVRPMLGDLPWLLPRHTGAATFIDALTALSRHPLQGITDNVHNFLLMREHCTPSPDPVADDYPAVTRNSYTSQKRRLLLRKFGLHQSNCHGAFLCRDILLLKSRPDRHY